MQAGGPPSTAENGASTPPTGASSGVGTAPPVTKPIPSLDKGLPGLSPTLSALGSPKGAASASGDGTASEHQVLANFFNSLISRDRNNPSMKGLNVPTPKSTPTGTPNISKDSAKVSLEKLKSSIPSKPPNN